MPLLNMSSKANLALPYGQRDILQIAVDTDTCTNVVRAVLRGEPLKSRARQRVYRALEKMERLHWIGVQP